MFSRSSAAWRTCQSGSVDAASQLRLDLVALERGEREHGAAAGSRACRRTRRAPPAVSPGRPARRAPRPPTRVRAGRRAPSRRCTSAAIAARRRARVFADRERGGLGDPRVVVGEQLDEHGARRRRVRAWARPRPRGAGRGRRGRARPGASGRADPARCGADERGDGDRAHAAGSGRRRRARRARARRSRPRPPRPGRLRPRVATLSGRRFPTAAPSVCRSSLDGSIWFGRTAAGRSSLAMLRGRCRGRGDTDPVRLPARSRLGTAQPPRLEATIMTPIATVPTTNAAPSAVTAIRPKIRANV